MERWATATTPTALPPWQSIGHAPWEAGPPARRRREEPEGAALLACQTCQQGFRADDRVIVAVPFRDLGQRVLMGRELLVHESCAPLRDGLRVVGRGWHGEIIDGMLHRFQQPGRRHERPDSMSILVEESDEVMLETPDTMSVPVIHRSHAPQP